MNVKNIKHYQRQIRPKDHRSYNIISGRYEDDHEKRWIKEMQTIDTSTINKFNQHHVFDNISAKYYNPEKEAEYQS
jgi:hypothetical protein